MSLKITALEMLVMPTSDGALSSLQEEGAKELRHRKDTLVALKKYFENNCPEKIKYPEYYEFHLYVAIVEDLL